MDGVSFGCFHVPNQVSFPRGSRDKIPMIVPDHSPVEARKVSASKDASTLIFAESIGGFNPKETK